MDIQQGQLTLIASGVVAFPPIGNPESSVIGCFVTREAGSPATFLVTCDGQPFANFPFDSIIEVDAFQENGFPIEMFWVYVNANSFRLIARQTNNGSAVLSSFNFKVYRQPNFGRVDLGPIPPGPSPFPPFVPTFGLGDVFVFRPGGVASGNVYTDWALLMADCDLVAGPRTISFDDSIVSPCVIPAGVWNMFEVVWTAPASIVQVDVSEGASFTRLRKITGGIAITWSGLTPPVADLGQTGTGLDIFVLDGQGTGAGATLLGAGIFATGPSTGPFFQMPGPGSVVEISLQNEAFMFKDPGSFQLIDQPNGGDLIVSLGISCLFDSDLINSAGINTTTLQYSASSIFGIGQSQPGVPSLGIYVATKLRMNPTPSIFANGTNAPATLDPNPQVNDIVRCDPTAGSFNVTLPTIANAGSGGFVTVKIVAISANSVTIMPQGADTIDGGGGFILSALQLSCLVLMSDGISNWMIVSIYP